MHCTKVSNNNHKSLARLGVNEICRLAGCVFAKQGKGTATSTNVLKAVVPFVRSSRAICQPVKVIWELL